MKNSIWKTLGAIIVGVLVVGFVVDRMFLVDLYGSADQVDTVLIYPQTNGIALVVFDAIHHSGEDSHDSERLNLWVPGENKPRIRKRLPGASLLAVSGRLLWMYSSDQGFHARDANTLEVRVDEATLKSRNPSLAVGLVSAYKRDSSYQSPFWFDSETGGLVVTTLDARQFLIDPESFQVVPFTRERNEGHWGHCAGRLQEQAVQRVELRGSGPRQEARFGDHSLGEFITPAALEICGADGHPTEVLPPPESALLLHRSSLKEDAPLLLTRAPIQGSALWTVNLGELFHWDSLTIHFAAMSGDDIVLGVSGQSSWNSFHYNLVTLDGRDGHLKSSVRL